MHDKKKLLSIKNLSTYFFTDQGVAKAVDDVSFDIENGQVFALVGESGCGKSVTSLSIMNLVPNPPGKIVAGQIIFDDQDLRNLSKKDIREIRGNKIAMIFQEPMTSLNPVYTIGNQICETIKLHQGKNKNAKDRRKLAIELLAKVGIDNPNQRIDEYPHQLSGGMRQRVMIAMAISCKPKLLIADEPTTALDVTIQSQILKLLDKLRKQEKMSILLITHDLAVVAEQAEVVAVMYASKIVEKSPCQSLFEKPLHPYTIGLMKSLPQIEPIEKTNKKRLHTIEGSVPNPLDFPTGCKFHPRCSIGCDDKKCQTIEPKLKQVENDRFVACWKATGYEK